MTMSTSTEDSSENMSKKCKSSTNLASALSTKSKKFEMITDAGGCTCAAKFPKRQEQYVITVWITYSGILSIYPSDGEEEN